MAAKKTQTIENIVYQDSKVDVDGKTFVSCQFSNVTFAYAGGPAPAFVGCQFDGIVLQFGSQAADTLDLLTKMNQTGLAGSVQRLLSTIRGGAR